MINDSLGWFRTFIGFLPRFVESCKISWREPTTSARMPMQLSHAISFTLKRLLSTKSAASLLRMWIKRCSRLQNRFRSTTRLWPSKQDFVPADCFLHLLFSRMAQINPIYSLETQNMEQLVKNNALLQLGIADIVPEPKADHSQIILLIVFHWLVVDDEKHLQVQGLDHTHLTFFSRKE